MRWKLPLDRADLPLLWRHQKRVLASLLPEMVTKISPSLSLTTLGLCLEGKSHAGTTRPRQR